LMTLGVARRGAAVVLAATLLPVTYVGHGFWREEPGPTRRAQRTHFLKNSAIFGGLVLLALDDRSVSCR